MAIELSRLIKKVEHMDITLLAGKNGMSNMVTWVHMAEIMRICCFAIGGAKNGI
ncbi:MAG: PucR family transcriptional regulator ligand-binding domain-containing protein [Lachnospiraceae bacterium]|nr:PucR family transcriptional regulator ligand-binding domain-containing protein [Lachnospiraceae bacterium]